MNKQLLGIIYLIIGLTSVTYGMFYLSEMNQNNLGISLNYLVFLIPAFTLSGISFYYGVRFLKFKNTVRGANV